MYKKLLEIINTIRQFFLNLFNLNSKKKKSQTDLTSSESQSGAVELTIVNLAIGSATINIGEEATLQVTLTNNGDPVTLTKGDSNIEFNVPSFIDLAHVKIEEPSAPWMEGDKNPAQNSFTILCNNNGTWAKGSTITFNLTQINAVGNEASTGNFTAFSADVLDYNTLSVPVILSAQDSVNPPANLVDVLGVTLNNGGTIFVNDPPLLNQLTLNFKNLVSDRPIFKGTTWPSTANPQVYISFIWGAGSGALTTLDTLNTQMISLSAYETTSDWNPDQSTSNKLPIWTLSPPKDRDEDEDKKDSDILGTGDLANATFQFSDIAPIVNGATQMYVQVTGFPYDEDSLYDTFTFLVPITKTYPPVKGIPYFSAADTPLNAIPGQPLLANFFWQVFDIPQVQLTATALGEELEWTSDVYTELLATDNHQVNLSQFFGVPSVIFYLYGLDGNGKRINGIVDHFPVEIEYPPITVQKFEVFAEDNSKNPKIAIEIYPLDLITKSTGGSGQPPTGEFFVSLNNVWLENNGNNPSKFIYNGVYNDLFTNPMEEGKQYTFSLNIALISGTFPGASVRYDCLPDLNIPQGNTHTLDQGSYKYGVVNIYGMLTINGAVSIECLGFQLASGGKIGGNGKGYAGGAASKNGLGPGGGQSSSGGAGHAGKGGNSTGGDSYDDPLSPSYPGSGGGGGIYSGGGPGGNGGAAIKVSVRNSIIVNGIIGCSGTAGGLSISAQAGGGGSGGSVWISGQRISGTGIIEVLGGSGGDAWQSIDLGGGGGSGGIILLEANDFSDWRGTNKINGGEGGKYDGGYGTGIPGSSGIYNEVVA